MPGEAGPTLWGGGAGTATWGPTQGAQARTLLPSRAPRTPTGLTVWEPAGQTPFQPGVPAAHCVTLGQPLSLSALQFPRWGHPERPFPWTGLL